MTFRSRSDQEKEKPRSPYIYRYMERKREQLCCSWHCVKIAVDTGWILQLTLGKNCSLHWVKIAVDTGRILQLTLGESECTESSRYELCQTKHKTCTLYARVSALKREDGERETDRQTDRQTAYACVQTWLLKASKKRPWTLSLCVWHLVTSWPRSEWLWVVWIYERTIRALNW